MGKRIADYQLTKDNFEQEDTPETNDKNNESHIAKEDVLKTRNILKAKRRNLDSTSSIFTGFKGFVSNNNGLSSSTKTEFNFTSKSTTSNPLSLFSFTQNKNSTDSKCDSKDVEKNSASSKKLNTETDSMKSVSETKNDSKKDIDQNVVDLIEKTSENQTTLIQNSLFLANLRKLNTNFVEHIQRYSSNPKYVYDYTLVCEEYVKKFSELKEMCNENCQTDNDKDTVDNNDNHNKDNNQINDDKDNNVDKKQNDLNKDSKQLPTFSQATTTKTLFGSNLMKDLDNDKSSDKNSDKSLGLFSFGTSTFNTKLNTEFKLNNLNKNLTTSTSLFPFQLNKTSESSAEPDKEAGEEKGGEAEEDVPPKIQSVEHRENDSVYTKKCKLFYKKDDNFVEKGIGYLYIKCGNEERAQLLIRADTNLGNILLNIALVETLPIFKADKNKGVLLTCVPNPPVEPNKKINEDNKNTVTFLIRVKVADCDELYQNLLKYRK